MSALFKTQVVWRENMGGYIFTRLCNVVHGDYSVSRELLAAELNKVLEISPDAEVKVDIRQAKVKSTGWNVEKEVAAVFLPHALLVDGQAMQQFYPRSLGIAQFIERAFEWYMSMIHHEGSQASFDRYEQSA